MRQKLQKKLSKNFDISRWSNFVFIYNPCFDIFHWGPNHQLLTFWEPFYWKLKSVVCMVKSWKSKRCKSRFKYSQTSIVKLIFLQHQLLHSSCKGSNQLSFPWGRLLNRKTSQYFRWCPPWCAEMAECLNEFLDFGFQTHFFQYHQIGFFQQDLYRQIFYLKYTMQQEKGQIYSLIAIKTSQSCQKIVLLIYFVSNCISWKFSKILYWVPPSKSQSAALYSSG